MRCKEIIEIIESTYPKHAAFEWDNVGLLVGRTEKEVKKIYVAVDATDEVIEEAIEAGADMLVTHHPLIFSPLKKITNESFIGNRVVKLLQHDISYYAMHTNYDIIGMGKLAGEILGLHETEVLEEVEEGSGIGVVGLLYESGTVRDCCELVKEKFALENVKVFGELQRTVKRVAISPGSGKSVIKTALQKGADVLVTGDIDHHEGIDAIAQGLVIIDAGHYGLEHIFMEDMVCFLREKINHIAVERTEIMHPFQVI